MFKFVIYDKDHSKLRVNRNNISISTEFSGTRRQLIDYIKVVVERLFTFAIDNGVEEYLYNFISREYNIRHPEEYEKIKPESYDLSLEQKERIKQIYKTGKTHAVTYLKPDKSDI